MVIFNQIPMISKEELPDPTGLIPALKTVKVVRTRN